MDALKKDFFAFFSLTPMYALDEAQLEVSFRRIQSSMHPDRFVNASDAERRYAMQLSTKANEAHQTLADSLKRARYICELNGQDVGAEDNTAMPAEFLMEQMSWHEALDEWRDDPQSQVLQELVDRNQQAQQSLRDKLAQQIDVDHDFESAAQSVRQFMFLDRFAQQLKAAGRSAANS